MQPLKRGSLICAIQELLYESEGLALCCGSFLVDIDRRVNSVLPLVHQIPDCHCIQSVQSNFSIVARADVNEVSGLTSSVRRNTVLLAWTNVCDALTLKNGNAFKIEILDRRDLESQAQWKEANTDHRETRDYTLPHGNSPPAIRIARNVTLAL